MKKIIKSNIQFVHILFCTLFILMLAVVSVSDTHAAVKIKETRLDCEDANYFSGGRLAVEKNGKWGFVDKHGKIVIRCKYDYIVSGFGKNGIAIVEKNGYRGLVDRNGKEIVPCTKYVSIWSVFRYNDPSEIWYMVEKRNGKVGFIDKKGAVVVSCIYDDASKLFYTNVALVCKDGKWGCVNRSGKVIVPCEYEEKDIAYTYSYSSLFEEIYIKAKDGKQWVLWNSDGKKVFECECDNLYSMGENLVSVKRNEKWGVMDLNGKEVIPFKYDTDFSMANGWILVQMDGKWGYINKRGEQLIPCEYEWIGLDSNAKMLRFLKNGKYGWMNLKGKQVIPCKYDRPDFFDGEVAVVVKNGKYGVINKKGKEIVKCNYDEIFGFLGRKYACIEKNGKYGYIDRSGKVVVPCRYNSASISNDGIAAVQRDGKWYLLTISNVKTS